MDQDGNKWLSVTELEQLDVSVAAGLAERHQLKRSALARAQADRLLWLSRHIAGCNLHPMWIFLVVQIQSCIDFVGQVTSVHCRNLVT